MSRSTLAVATVATRLAGLAMALLGSVVVSRVLGPEGRGAYSVIVVVAMSALTLGHLSVGSSAVALWEDVADRAALRASAALLGISTGLIASAIAWVATRIVWPHAFPISSEPALVAALLAVPLGVAVINLNAVLLADGEVKRVNIGSLVAGVVQTLGLAALAASGRLTVTAVVVCWAANTAAPLVVLGWRSGWLPSKASRAVMRRMLSIGVRFHLGMAAAFLLFRVDILLLNTRVDAREVGLYSLAVSLIEMTYILTESIAQVALHRQASASRSEAAVYTARVARTSFGVALAGVLAVLAAGPVVVPVIFGSEFGPALGMMVALAPGIIALGAIRPIGAYATREGRALLHAAGYILTLAVNIGLNIVLIPRWGGVGAGIASSCAYLIFVILGVGWFRRATSLNYRDMVPCWSDFRDPIAAVIADRRDSAR